MNLCIFGHDWKCWGINSECYTSFSNGDKYHSVSFYECRHCLKRKIRLDKSDYFANQSHTGIHNMKIRWKEFRIVPEGTERAPTNSETNVIPFKVIENDDA